MSTVKDVLTTKGGDVATVLKDDSVMDAVKKMTDRRIGAVVVMESDQIAGIFTERDVMCRVVAAGKNPANTKVREVMTAKVAFVVKNTTLEACRAIMTRHKLRHLPVIENSRLVGIISSGDILARELKDQEETIKFLHEYMQGPN